MKSERGDEDTLLAALTRCETDVWDALVIGNMRADDAALDDGFLGVYSDGFAGKADHVQQLADGPTIQSFQLFDLRVLALGPDHAVLSYRAAYLRVHHSEPEAMYVSSIWRRKGQGWINVFSQDTPALG
ncbi:nuclear transport factor 2 family protein [Loktanella sp. Alg231-35]|uniref:nuclear transport factor 2 family protein n=1 Tax=Loktanella sp. Alg231-35 TaxID=1922220 RepID=UPI000D55898D|nr:nuclear transport factor 2 family protein [Loktanella sp. Alg231-35]